MEPDPVGVHAGKHGCSSGAVVSPAEELLFKRIETGHIKFGPDGAVKLYHYSHRKWIEKKPNQHPVSGRWRFMFSDGKGGRTNVYRNRLVWMIANKQRIPNDCFVDHEDGNRQNDDPSNLKLMKKSDSHGQGNEVLVQKTFHQLWRWFHFVELHRRPPAEEEEGDDSLLFV